jgi:hypothetical protein
MLNQAYRISVGPYFAELVDSVEDLEEFALQNGHGRYRVDEIRADPFRSGHTSRRWGVVIARPDGTVSVDRDPWPEP